VYIVCVNIVVVLVGCVRVMGTCVTQTAASRWRIFIFILLCGDAMWEMLIVFFLFLEFLTICCSFSFLHVVLF